MHAGNIYFYRIVNYISTGKVCWPINDNENTQPLATYDLLMTL